MYKDALNSRNTKRLTKYANLYNFSKKFMDVRVEYRLRKSKRIIELNKT